MQPWPLPTEAQHDKICDLIALAFIELSYLDGEQARDLTYAFHNRPKEICGWGIWSIEITRGRRAYYQAKHSGSLTFNYVEAFDSSFLLDFDDR